MIFNSNNFDLSASFLSICCSISNIYAENDTLANLEQLVFITMQYTTFGGQQRVSLLNGLYLSCFPINRHQ